MTQKNTESLDSNQGSLWEKVRGRTGQYNQKHNQSFVSCFVKGCINITWLVTKKV